ncbi:TPA: hypothetical protein ACNTUM_000882 [Escherichia coli]|nr:hypothetical protein [Escherichia coli]HCO3884059.1 hypothetical protein [Escherichia coli]
MAKIIKHWNVMVADKFIIQDGREPICLGKSRTQNPVIEHGFLMYENHEGCHAGINLSEVLAFSIEPEYEE